MPVDEGQSEDDSSDVVAIIPAKRRPQNKQGGQQSHRKGQQATGGKATMNKGLCWRHQMYGEDTFHCANKKNCTWSGN